MIKWSKELVIKKLIDSNNKLGHSPTSREINPTLYGACWNYFGSFNKAKLVANLPIQKVKYKKLKRGYNSLSNNLAYILGVILGDGHLAIMENVKRPSYYTLLKVKDKDFALEFKKRLENWSGHKVKYYLHKNGFYYSILYSKDATKFLKSFNINQILKSKKKIKYHFLKGLFDSEGCIAGSNLQKRRYATRIIKFFNNKSKIIKLVSKILKEIGINHSIRSRIHSGFGSQKLQYEITICGKENLYKFYKDIGFSIKRKQNKLIKVLNSYNGLNIS